MKVIRFAVLLIVAAVMLLTASCGEVPEGLWEGAIYNEDTTVGTGACEIYVTVTAGDKSIVLTVRTDKEYLGDALTELGIIEGTEGAYGLYIDKVNGILASWEADSAWWGIYEDGNAALSGADAIKISSGAKYELKYSK